MSYVHLIVTKDDKIYFVNVHYRTAVRLLEKGVNAVLPLLQHSFLDAGYIVVDLNKKVVINGQTAFRAGTVLKNEYVIEA